jgi:acyl-CoA dehydrogenase
MTWDFSTEPAFQEQLDWMRDFVRTEIWPLDAIADELDLAALDAALKPLQEEAKRHGLWAAHLDPAHGGQGFGQVKLGLMQEIIGTSYLGMVAFGCQAPDSGNSEIRALAGPAEQKERWLTPLLAGELRSCFSMTEPDTAGSDPTQLRTRAERDGDAWVINGRKWFSSNASVANFLIVVAATDPDAAPHRRATMFILPTDTPGVTVLRDVPTMGHPHTSFGQWGGHAEVLYENVRVGADSVLGGVGEGFAIAQKRLGPGRIHHCMRWLGQAQRALDMLCEYATHRYAHGSLLGEKGIVQAWIADSAAEIQAARLMTLHAAWKIDTQGVAAARQDIAMIKYFGAKVLLDVIDRAIQAHGSLGYSGDLPLEQMYRHARAARIYDGPDEVHRQSVARMVLKGFAAPADGIPTEHVPTRRELARARYAELLP